MVKAIFFDIDGTLMSFKTRQVPESTIKALKILKEKGIKTFIATGRAPKEMEPLLETIDFEFDGFISINGQLCYNDEHIFYESHISIDEIEKAIEYMDQNNIACDFIEKDYVYIDKITPQVEALCKSLGGSIDTKVIDDKNRIYSNKVFQICPYIFEEQEADLLAYMPSCKSARWHPLFVDIISKEGGKIKGIEEILKYYQIDLKDTMAFGDGGNDKEMLQFVQTGIAMGNAKEEIKAIADYVTESVDDDGIYKALQYFKVID